MCLCLLLSISVSALHPRETVITIVPISSIAVEETEPQRRYCLVAKSCLDFFEIT